MVAVPKVIALYCMVAALFTSRAFGCLKPLPRVTRFASRLAWRWLSPEL
jgi:hypothetical protein